MTTHALAAADILVVDDDRGVREMLTQLLEEEGWRVTGISNGTDALNYLRNVPQPPRLILLDLMMPEMNGWQFRALQQSEPPLAAIPVVAISAAKDIHDETRLDAVAYLSKPIDFDALFDLVERYVG